MRGGDKEMREGSEKCTVEREGLNEGRDEGEK